MIFSKLTRLKNPEWRKYYYWLYLSKRRKRKVEGYFFVKGIRVDYGDWGAFLGAYADIFCSNIYDFNSISDEPIILDIGANIGLATIWWKLRFPKARIVAIEADPAIFSLLKKNIERFNFDNVELINAAAWFEDGVLNFAPDGSDGGRVSLQGTEIKSVALSSIINRFEKVNFLKLDIEGGERAVMPSIEMSLKRVQTFFCEYHSSVGEPQLLEDILGAIARAGFRYHIKNLLASEKPFIILSESCGFDNQLNLFCTRK
jgi:FkbM family methyltransferase